MNRARRIALAMWARRKAQVELAAEARQGLSFADEYALEHAPDVATVMFAQLSSEEQERYRAHAAKLVDKHVRFVVPIRQPDMLQ